ncbi:SAM-dependent methyltransferase [Nocardia sp. SYP-A9097]|uniref:class I SAM-dependent methyltransferase n=1 Tax=Nocardia sp. SYP-A9097 TaxID=2663237 RepID=UPI0013224272|nr:class I SAM-dependent methyltransferase [Nocardia sp. SYP-A9097]MRH92295.1 SAM-dependent methyltransferase [Nocardia sp. SYP-A9097]
MADQIAVTAQLTDYIRHVSLREDEILRELRAETADLPGGTAMQVLAEEGQLLALLAGLVNAHAILEIGTFTGYSTLCLARALPATGRLITCDITDRWPAIGVPYWGRAGVGDRIELRVGEACATLEQMLADEGPGLFDLVFIDADKANYPRYYELSLELVRLGGLIVVDNTLFFGRVADPGAQDADTQGVRELNALLRSDDRVEISMLTMADGITLAHRLT